MTTFPLPVLSCTIDASGISAPSYADILSSLKASFQGIYGSDVYLEADSQDGQLLAIYAKVINDNNNACIAAYNSFSPATAQGNGLSSNVKINGLKRNTPSESTSVITVGGTVGFIITNGLVGDDQNLGTQWELPGSVTIGGGGTTDVVATCTTPGAVIAPPGTLTKILNPQLGWQTATNAASVTPGNPVEIDAALRQRQSKSTGLPAQSIIDAVAAALDALPNVLDVKGYQNNTASTDANGMPEHSIAFVVTGGDATQICETIAAKKNPGPSTEGTTTQSVTDPAGITDSISFYITGQTSIDVVITGTALPGYVSTTAPLIQAALVQAINNLDIGDDSYTGWLWGAASLQGDDAIEGVSALLGRQIDQPYLDQFRKTYKITNVQQCLHGGTPGSADVTVPFTSAAFTQSSQVTVNIS